MRSKSEEIRKRIERRKKQRDRMTKRIEAQLPWTEDEERYGFEKLSSFDGDHTNEEDHPLFRKEVFLFKLLASACLILITAIMFRSELPSLSPAKEFVTKTMNDEFEFAAVSNWYESKFGKPFALFPTPNQSKENEASTVDSKQEDMHYALPASGKVLEKFGEDGQKITIETAKGASVEAMNEGLIIEIGEKEGFGKTVVVQHADKSESWYGNLSSINVSLYEYIKKGTVVGKATDYEDKTNSSFYFAIKEGADFIDPVQVIDFE